MGLIHIYASIARSLNYRRSGVQEWIAKKALHKDNNTARGGGARAGGGGGGGEDAETEGERERVI
jgi:hypothetical protein